MNIQAVKLSESMAKEIASWKYDGDYAMYNLPSWEDMMHNQWALCDHMKRRRFIGFTNEEADLVGFVNLLDEGAHIFFGIGLKPTLCGIGLGKQIIQEALIECRERYGQKPIVLEVRSWNKRAIKCYESQGFRVIKVVQQETFIGPGEFYVMQFN